MEDANVEWLIQMTLKEFFISIITIFHVKIVLTLFYQFGIEVAQKPGGWDHQPVH
jgi:hypothetical protein